TCALPICGEPLVDSAICAPGAAGLSPISPTASASPVRRSTRSRPRSTTLLCRFGRGRYCGDGILELGKACDNPDPAWPLAECNGNCCSACRCLDYCTDYGHPQ